MRPKLSWIERLASNQIARDQIVKPGEPPVRARIHEESL